MLPFVTREYGEGCSPRTPNALGVWWKGGPGSGPGAALSLGLVLVSRGRHVRDLLDHVSVGQGGDVPELALLGDVFQ